MTVTEQDFINFFIRSHCTSLSVAEVAKTVLREYVLTPRDAATTPSKPFHPDSHLPGCMMPDGGDCCVGYQELLADWRRLLSALAFHEEANQREIPPRPEPSVPFRKG